MLESGLSFDLQTFETRGVIPIKNNNEIEMYFVQETVGNERAVAV